MFERHILIQRYMRRDDPANPAAWADLLQRIQQVDEKVQRRKNREKIQRSGAAMFAGERPPVAT